MRQHFSRAAAAAAVLGLAAAGTTATIAARALTPLDQFTCRASAVRALGTVEPAVANRVSPVCLTEDAPGPLPVVSAGGVTAQAVSAHTDVLREDRPRPGDHGSGDATAGSADISSGGTLISVRGATAHADATCPAPLPADGKPVLHGSSHVGVVTVNGSTISDVSGSRDIAVAGVGTLHLNYQAPDPLLAVVGGGLIQRAIWLDTGNPLTDVVVAEAKAGYTGRPCQPPVCTPDEANVNPIPAPHTHADQCAWATPAGTGFDFAHLGGRLPGDTSGLNGKVGIYEKNGRPLGRAIEGDFFRDDARHFMLRADSIDAWLAPIDTLSQPAGDANSRWRRYCGTGTVVATGSGSGSGSGGGGGTSGLFVNGERRRFMVELFDGEFPAEASGEHTSYAVIDIYRAGDASLDTTTCDPDVGGPDHAGAGIALHSEGALTDGHVDLRSQRSVPATEDS